MRPAILYCRKSTKDQREAADQSVTRQEELGRVYAAELGTEVVHVYVDNEVPAKDWKNRMDWKRLRADVEAGRWGKSPLLIVMDQARLMREPKRGPAEVGAVEDAGVEIRAYATKQRITFADDAADSDAMLTGMNAVVDTAHSRNVRRGTKEALDRKAKAGYATGRKQYGYDHRPVMVGDKKSHVERVKNDAQAQVIHRIFKLVANGAGYKSIAKLLNAENIPGTTVRGVTRPWAATTIRAIVKNPLYKGVVQFRKERVIKGPERNRRIPTPDLIVGGSFPEQAIVTDQEWNAAHARLEKTMALLKAYRKGDGTLAGRPTGLDSRHLLSGMLTCAGCGGAMKLLTISRGGKVRRAYACARHRLGKGEGDVCRPWAPYDPLVSAVRSALDPEAIQREMIAYLSTIPLTDPDDQRAKLTADLVRLDGELGRLTEAVVAGGEIKALVDRMKATQVQRDEVAASLASATTITEKWTDLKNKDPAAIAEEYALLDEARPDLTADRRILSKLLVGRLRVAPVLVGGKATAWEITGLGTVGRIVADRLGVPGGMTGAGAAREYTLPGVLECSTRPGPR